MRQSTSHMKPLLAAMVLFFGVTTGALAVNPNEMLPDPAQEHRARELGKELRCLVCQNQSIDDSDADLARDLRIIVRERIVAGDSDNQVLQYVVDRYGDFVLLRPPFKLSTLALWLGPLLLFGLALAAVLAFYRRGRQAAAELAASPLSAEEENRIAQLLDKDAGK